MPSFGQGFESSCRFATSATTGRPRKSTLNRRAQCCLNYNIKTLQGALRSQKVRCQKGRVAVLPLTAANPSCCACSPIVGREESEKEGTAKKKGKKKKHHLINADSLLAGMYLIQTPVVCICAKLNACNHHKLLIKLGASLERDHTYHHLWGFEQHSNWLTVPSSPFALVLPILQFSNCQLVA